MRIAIVDILGLSYDGSTLNKRGLGGSESAVISISKELVKLGCNVTVFNDCVSADDVSPGYFDNVRYVPYNQATAFDMNFDVLISSRSCAVFVDENERHNFKNTLGIPLFDRLVNNDKVHKVLWLHDTFCDGDQFLEQLVIQGKINELFTLTDWHTSYVTNCDHGIRRNFDILKKKIFQTRNGINKWNSDWIDIRAKDPNLFVFNASVTKGMVPLVTKIWPVVKSQFPEAKLTVIGGYYRFPNGEPDAQEIAWRDLVEEHKSSINFTGVINQKEISNILTEASYMLYPCAFPETFGISSLEALAHNVPLITCNFGGLEETAIDQACYKINYPVEKNWSLPWLNEEDQAEKFIQLTSSAFQNKYLHQQKMYACNQVKDICTWDTVALQWKQHLYKITGRYLPVNEYREVQKINYKVASTFGRRFINQEELAVPKNFERRILVVTPVYNAENYIRECMESVARQDYNNFTMVIIDDKSTDNTLEIVRSAIDSFGNIDFRIVSNDQNMGAIYNQVHAINENGENWDDIIVLLDGDDKLPNDPNIFHKINNIYYNGAEFTYGSCWSMADNIPLIAQEYPPEVKANRSYRDYKFNWNMPYTHLRTFVHDLYLKVKEEELTFDGKFPKAGGDTALFYALIEKADPSRIVAVPEIMYIYNDKNPLCDYKVNGEEQTKTANRIMSKEKNNLKTILIAVPTANDIDAATFKSIYDLTIPEGYKTDFNSFFGYRVDQVRNLICEWSKKYDYVLCVDHDMILPNDTLVKLLKYDVPIVSGLYKQRNTEQLLEIYDLDYKRWDISDKTKLIEIGACGFGCVLVKSEVFEKVGYPQFEYHPALDHKNTFSEDVDFCKKVRSLDIPIYADPTIQCGHIGKTTHYIVPKENSVKARLRDLANQPLLPTDHVKYLEELSMSMRPKVIYDIGSCVMHWTSHAKRVWPGSDFVCFEAMDEVDFLYNELNIPLVYGYVLGNEDNKDVEFYMNVEHPGGNSMFKESRKLSPRAEELFPESSKVVKKMMTLDTLVKTYSIPLPNMIKMDVQGSELNVLKGAIETLKNVTDLILELQHKDYNEGAPKMKEVSTYLKHIGFTLKSKITEGELGVDADYHFVRT